MTYHDHLSLEELWARILLRLDLQHDALQCDGSDFSATDLTALSGALAALRGDGPLAPAAADHIACALDVLEEAVSRETLGHRNTFDGIDDPEVGAVGQVRSVPILSDRGAGLDRHLREFRQVLAMRDRLAARVDTARQIARLTAA